jgi:hydroxymethylglutaryl-CoA lyase
VSEGVTVVEVGPRDGLQNEKESVRLADKIALIDRLSAAGLPVIEAGAFVSPKWVPQMADSAAVLAGIKRRPGVRYPVLVPNLQGYAAAKAAGVQEINVFTAASETFNRKNINASIAESLERLKPVCAAAKADGLRLRASVSTVMGCPYEGAVPVAKVVEVCEALRALGADEISLGDTIGVGTAGQARALIRALVQTIPVAALAAHFHDTYGQALANVLACLEEGVRVVDSSVAGLGGCPYAKGATGNLASEDLVYMLDGLGFETGIDLEQLIDAGAFISARLGRQPASRVARAKLAKRQAA